MPSFTRNFFFERRAFSKCCLTMTSSTPRVRTLFKNSFDIIYTRYGIPQLLLKLYHIITFLMFRHFKPKKHANPKQLLRIIRLLGLAALGLIFGMTGPFFFFAENPPHSPTKNNT